MTPALAGCKSPHSRTYCGAALRSRQRPDQIIMMLSATAPHGGDVPVRRNGEAHPPTGFWALTIGSIGVVYGVIGTSPLYAIPEAIVAATGGGAITEAAVFGVLSLI